MQVSPYPVRAFPEIEVGRGSLTKFFKEGLHEAGPGVEVGCVHIQIGDFFFWEEGEHTNSEEDGDRQKPTLRKG